MKYQATDKIVEYKPNILLGYLQWILINNETQKCFHDGEIGIINCYIFSFGLN